MCTSLEKLLKGRQASPQKSSLSSSHSQTSLIYSETAMKLCLEWFSSLAWSSFLSRGLSSKICSKSLSRLILSMDSLRSVRLTDWSSWKLRFSLMTSASSWEELGLTFYCSSIMIFKLISVKIIILMMEISQSKVNPRGPLIAVIKIQIDDQRSDRIFLHQRDQDRDLAQSFVQKHSLNPMLIPHIYQKIKFSRDSVEQTAMEVTPQRTQKMNHQNSINYTNSNFKLHTPLNYINTHRDAIEEEQSFGKSGQKSDRYHYLRKVYGQSDHICPKNEQIEDLFTQPFKNKPEKYPEQRILPEKKQDILKGKEFLLYDQNINEEEQQNDLFGTYRQSNNQNTFVLKQEPSTSKKQQLMPFEPELVRNSEKKQKNVLEIINKKQTQERKLGSSKSMMKLNNERYSHVQPIIKTITNFTPASKSQIFDKPCHVKIIKKDEMQSIHQSLRKSKSKQQISRISKDVTKRLYNQTQIKKNYLKIIKEKAKIDKVKEIDPELTLKPKINKVSQVIAEGRRRGQIPIQVYLMEEGKKAEVKRSQILSHKIQTEVEQCTFKPQLNIISQKLASDKQKIQSRISRKSRYQDENTFRPNIGRITNELMKDKGNFVERQKLYLQIKNEKLMDLVHDKILKQKIDLNTGQELFKPVINDLGIRQSQGSNIGNYLYQLNKETPEQEQRQAKPRISESSQSIVQQMYMKRVAWLFSELDSDQDGLISSHKICIDTISPEVLAVIKPILFEMQDINEELTLLDFKNAIEQLHKKLNLTQKHTLYNLKQKVK